MSPLLLRILVALGHGGLQTPIDATLGNAYQALRECHDSFPSAFPQAAEILIAEIEGGATTIADIPKRIAQLAGMLDRLHRQENLGTWAVKDLVTS